MPFASFRGRSDAAMPQKTGFQRKCHEPLRCSNRRRLGHAEPRAGRWASQRSFSRIFSSTIRRSIGSRSFPRTSWTPAAGRAMCSIRSPSDIRSSCMACRCRSAAPIRSISIISAKLKRLAAEVNARWVSDHLCWTGVLGKNSHDLLPVPLNEQTLKHVVERIRDRARHPRAAVRAGESQQLCDVCRVRRCPNGNLSVAWPKRPIAACCST